MLRVQENGQKNTSSHQSYLGPLSVCFSQSSLGIVLIICNISIAHSIFIDLFKERRRNKWFSSSLGIQLQVSLPSLSSARVSAGWGGERCFDCIMRLCCFCCWAMWIFSDFSSIHSPLPSSQLSNPKSKVTKVMEIDYTPVHTKATM